MSNLSGELVLQYGPDAGRVYSLTDQIFTVGRGQENDLTLEDPEISRRQAQIVQRDDQYVIEDFGSTNGTFVNGHRISDPVLLQDGDIVVFGETVTFTFQTPLAAALSPPSGTPVRQPTAESKSVPDQQPVQAAREQPYEQPPPRRPVEPVYYPPPPQEQGRGCWRWFAGCGCAFILLIFLCAASFWFLDFYQDGSLLYCGPLRPFFEWLPAWLGINPVACPFVG